MKRCLTLLLLMPSLVLAQGYSQGAPFILPYQGTIYNGPGLSNQGYMPSMSPMMAPPMLPMMAQPMYSPWTQQPQDWRQQPFGSRQPWSPPQGSQGQGSQNRMGSLLLPLMALGLAMFAGMNTDGLSQSYEDGNSSDYDQDFDQDNGHDSRTQAEAPIASCRSCRSGIHRTSTKALREVAPRSPLPVELVREVQPAARTVIPQSGEPVSPPPVPASRQDFAESSDVPSPSHTAAPAPSSPVIAGGVRATPVVTPPPAEKPAPVATPVPGVGTPRRETPRTPSVVPAINSDERRAQGAPVWNSFIQNLNQCAPGCTPVQYASYGSRSHPTCHTTGAAMDVFGIRCGGRTYMAINRGKFEEMVTCMKTKMKVLYRNHPDRNETEGHRNHAHFSIGCYVNGGHRYW